MILSNDLIELGFTQDKDDTQDFLKGRLCISLQEGIITFIREWDNYHGLSVNIKTIAELELFLKYIDK